MDKIVENGINLQYNNHLLSDQKVDVEVTFPRERTPLTTQSTVIVQPANKHSSKCTWTDPVSSSPLDLRSTLYL